MGKEEWMRQETQRGREGGKNAAIEVRIENARSFHILPCVLIFLMVFRGFLMVSSVVAHNVWVNIHYHLVRSRKKPTKLATRRPNKPQKSRKTKTTYLAQYTLFVHFFIPTLPKIMGHFPHLFRIKNSARFTQYLVIILGNTLTIFLILKRARQMVHNFGQHRYLNIDTINCTSID